MNKNPINMHDPDGHDWLDKMLAGNNDIHNQYIHDGGFTESVMSRLPPRRQNKWLSGFIFGCAILLSTAFLLLSTPALTSLYADLLALLRAQPLYMLGVLAVALYAATTIIAWWAVNPEV
jgi:hypothetical protein